MEKVRLDVERCKGCYLCIENCKIGAISLSGYTNGKGVVTVQVDQDKCVGCLTCVLVCPYGALAPNENGVMQKCELCLENAGGQPACVIGCPNKAIVYEERGAVE